MWAFIALSFCVFLCDLKQRKKKMVLELLKEKKNLCLSSTILYLQGQRAEFTQAGRGRVNFHTIPHKNVTAEPFSVCCCQNWWFLAPSSLLPTLCPAAPLCAGAHLAFGELNLTQLKHCGVWFFLFSGWIFCSFSEKNWVVQEEPVKCHGCGWKSGVEFWLGERCWLQVEVVPLCLCSGWGPWGGGMAVPGTPHASATLCWGLAASLAISCPLPAPFGAGGAFSDGFLDSSNSCQPATISLHGEQRPFAQRPALIKFPSVLSCCPLTQDTSRNHLSPMWSTSCPF